MPATSTVAKGTDGTTHIVIESKRYISVGNPIMETEDIKLATKESATGTGPIFPPAKITSFVDWRFRFLNAWYTPIKSEIERVKAKMTLSTTENVLVLIMS